MITHLLAPAPFSIRGRDYQIGQGASPGASLTLFFACEIIFAWAPALIASGQNASPSPAKISPRNAGPWVGRYFLISGVPEFAAGAKIERTLLRCNYYKLNLIPFITFNK